MNDITLFEFAPTRSARVRWTLLEVGLDFESIGLDDPSVFGNPELFAVHPLGKLPAAKIDGMPLFESAAICAAIADRKPGKDLIARPGTWDRCLHDQWSYFALAEMESWLTANMMNTFILPEEQRITACIDQNIALYKKNAKLLEGVLGESDYLVGNRFSVTDIIVGFTINAAERMGYNDDMPNLQRYVERLHEREHCTLQK